MASLEEQLALFEQEMMAVTSEALQPPLQTSNGEEAKSSPPQPGEEANQASSTPPQGPTLQPPKPSATAMLFTPHQLHVPHYTTLRQAGVPEPPKVIEAGPTLYAKANAASATEKDLGSTQAIASATGGSTATSTPARLEMPPLAPGLAGSSTQADQPSSSGGLKPMTLPSDVELVATKKQERRAHENSYLGQVLRGERKMKRFLRSAGGETWEDSSLAEWDPNDFRLFCGDLGNEVSDELLAKAFRKYPSFQKAKVIRDHRSNKSKGYGFVSFKHQDDFVRACREMDGKYVGNRPIKLRKSVWKERSFEVVKKKKKEKQKLGLLHGAQREGGEMDEQMEFEAPVNDENQASRDESMLEEKPSIRLGNELVDVDLTAVEGIDANAEGTPIVAERLKRNSPEAVAEAKERLARWLLDEGKPITAAYALKRCQLDAEHMQKVLEDFLEFNEDSVSVCYWLVGERKLEFDECEDDGIERIAVRICQGEEELKKMKEQIFSRITEQRIYSMQSSAGVKDMQAIYNVDLLDPMPPYKPALEGKTDVLYPRALRNYRRYKSTEAEYLERMEKRRRQFTFDLMRRNEPLGKKERELKQQQLQTGGPQASQQEQQDGTAASQGAQKRQLPVMVPVKGVQRWEPKKKKGDTRPPAVTLHNFFGKRGNQ